MSVVLKLFTILLILLPKIAAAHPAEQALVLLLPTELYTTAGTLTVVASIVLISVLPVGLTDRVFRSAALVGASRFGTIQTVTSLISTACVFALIYVGITGPRDPQANLLPLMLWTGWWIGLFTVQGLLFDVWRWINPWSALYDLLIQRPEPILRFPNWLGAWPAAVLFFAYQVFLLADIAPSDPNRLANILLGYWVFTFTAMILFGKDAWLRRGEWVTVLFGLIGRLRIVHWDDRLRIGLPGWRALTEKLDVSLATFCLMILISGSFDGLKETFWWLGRIGVNPLEFPGRSAVVVPSVLGLIGAHVVVLTLFVAALALGILGLNTKAKPGLKDCYCRFAIAILPIALGYHIAHYLVTALVQTQYLAATLGDPLARGRNLFGLGHIRVTTGFLNTTDTVRMILLTNVYAVVISHVISVVMAHKIAGDLAQTRRDVIVLQLGLSALMIAYTVFGLWLLSTPRGA